jgi:hypothetical protein
MTTTTKTVENIKESFPYPTIPIQNGKPTYETINATHEKLKINAAAIPTKLGGGRHGHLGLVLSPATYNAVTGTPFTLPADPGVHPVHPTGATGAQIAQITRQHNADTKTWTECLNTDTALKNQIIATFEEKYLRSLHNKYTGYANTTAMEMLEQLYQKYGKISAADLFANEEKLHLPYNPAEPIETLFDRFENAMEYAEAAKHPFSQEIILSKAFLLMQKTGQFQHACREWKRTQRPTWALFKAHFTEAHLEYEETEAFAANSGYTANHILEQATHEMANLITAVTEREDKQQMEIANLTIKNNTLEQELAAIKQLMHDIKANLPTMIQQTSQQTSTPAQATQPTKEEKLQKLKEKFDNPEAYCWMHGYTGTNSHNSHNCKKKIDGHQTAATKSNTMGGNTTRSRGFWTANKLKK